MRLIEALETPHDPYCPVAQKEYEDLGGEALRPPICRCSHAEAVREAAMFPVEH